MKGLAARDRLAAEAIAAHPEGNADLIRVQASLAVLGYSLGEDGINGLTGIDTAGAVKEFQLAMGLEPTGKPDGRVKSALTEALAAGLSREDIIKRALEAGRGATDISSKGVKFVAAYEGFSPKVYRDAAGRNTIGYGHSLKKGESFPGGITEEQALALLHNDLQEAVSTVRATISIPLTQEQMDALVSLAYNTGQIGENLANAINRGLYSEVEWRIKAYQYVGNQVYHGLVKRRADEWELYATGDYERNHTP